MRVLLIHGLGICERCGSLFTVQDIPEGVGWICPACKFKITDRSLGYEEYEGEKRVKWVNKNGWGPKPKKDFDLVINSERCHIITKLDKSFGPRNQMSCFRI